MGPRGKMEWVLAEIVINTCGLFINLLQENLKALGERCYVSKLPRVFYFEYYFRFKSFCSCSLARTERKETVSYI